MDELNKLQNHRRTALAYAIVAVLSGMSALADERPIAPVVDVAPTARLQKPQRHALPVASLKAAAPEVELTTKGAIANKGFDTGSAFTAAVPSPDSQTLSAPVTITYSGSSPVFLVNDNGSNKGVESVINNSHNSTSALYGQTNGSGAGLTGYNSGTGGPAGKFGITNSTSSQSAVTTTTNGTGSALVATITAAQNYQPAILAQNQVTTGYGVGVQGQGNNSGIEGFGGYYGVYGEGSDYGMYGQTSAGVGVYGDSATGTGVAGYSASYYGSIGVSDTGTGMYGESTESYGVHAYSYTGTALYANSATGNRGVVAHSASGVAVYGSSDTGYGVWGQGTNTYGVIGEDSGSGIGVYGSSTSGYAGLFAGKVGATSYVTTSDRHAKTHIRPVNGQDILARIDRLPVDSWVFKTDLEKKHVGPMAQDFHAAFGLDGEDDKHINLTDIAGVSLAAIKELSAEMKDKDAQLRLKDAQIAFLEAQLKSIEETFSARLTALEVQPGRSAVVTQNVSLRTAAGAVGK